jgi:serine/threonine-protein kinase HipA
MTTGIQNKEIQVFADWKETNGPQFLGTLYTSRLRGKEVYEFEYDKLWLQKSWAIPLDPGLGLFSGRQYPSGDTQNFGLFLDSMPDRWGRQLMLRRESIIARQETRPANPLFDSDFLLGVHDEQRMGGLRFRLKGSSSFTNSDPFFSIPPWTSLRDLVFASQELEKDDQLSDTDQLKWLNMLIAPGSSLGGARPKAGVLDVNGKLWIAKFPSQMDNFNTGAWEMIVNKMGQQAGIKMALGMVEKLGNIYHTYLSKRFDRSPDGFRIHFASAMTMLRHTDGDDASAGVSYLEMVEFIQRASVQPVIDLEELWRRIVFSILVCNTDDHLRNHGFLLSPKGWMLSPAYDINPNPQGYGLRLNIDEYNNGLDVNLAFSVAEYFRLSHKKAKTIADEVKKSCKDWRKLAAEFQLSRDEIDRMAPAFLKME